MCNSNVENTKISKIAISLSPSYSLSFSLPIDNVRNIFNSAESGLITRWRACRVNFIASSTSTGAIKGIFHITSITHTHMHTLIHTCALTISKLSLSTYPHTPCNYVFLLLKLVQIFAHFSSSHSIIPNDSENRTSRRALIKLRKFSSLHPLVFLLMTYLWTYELKLCSETRKSKRKKKKKKKRRTKRPTLASANEIESAGSLRARITCATIIGITRM